MLDALNALRLTSKLRGVAVIIGNSYAQEDVTLSESQRQPIPLPGSLKDVSKLRIVFEYLKFLTAVKYNVTQADLLELLQHPFGHSPDPCTCHRFVFAFCGHGGDDCVYCEDEEYINFIDIIKTSSNYYSLHTVPRLFFFNVTNSGIVGHTENKTWHSQISKTDNVLVALSTSTGYGTFESNQWLHILAKKLVTCAKNIQTVIKEASDELFVTMHSKGGTDSHKLELIDHLDTTIDLLNESGDYLYVTTLALSVVQYTSYSYF